LLKARIAQLVGSASATVERSRRAIRTIPESGRITRRGIDSAVVLPAVGHEEADDFAARQG